MLFRRAFVCQLGWQAIATGSTFIGVGGDRCGDQSVRSVANSCRTGQDREALLLNRTGPTRFRRANGGLLTGSLPSARQQGGSCAGAKPSQLP